MPRGFSGCSIYRARCAYYHYFVVVVVGFGIYCLNMVLDFECALSFYARWGLTLYYFNLSVHSCLECGLRFVLFGILCFLPCFIFAIARNAFDLGVFYCTLFPFVVYRGVRGYAL